MRQDRGGLIQRLQERADAADTVLLLGKILVLRSRGKRLPRDQIPLIRQPGKACPEVRLELHLQMLHLGDHLSSTGRTDGDKAIVSRTKARQPHRDNRCREHRRPVSSCKAREILQGLLKGNAVIQPWTDHNLRVDLQVPLSEPTQLVEQQCCSWVLEQACPQGRLSGVDGDVQR